MEGVNKFFTLIKYLIMIFSSHYALTLQLLKCIQILSIANSSIKKNTLFYFHLHYCHRSINLTHCD